MRRLAILAQAIEAMQSYVLRDALARVDAGAGAAGTPAYLDCAGGYMRAWYGCAGNAMQPCAGHRYTGCVMIRRARACANISSMKSVIESALHAKIISAKQAEQLRMLSRNQQASTASRRWIGALGVIGAALLGISLSTFIGANWQTIPDVVKLALVGGGPSSGRAVSAISWRTCAAAIRCWAVRWSSWGH